jgi:hypothetical protein
VHRSVQDEGNNEENAENGVELGSDGVGGFWDLFHETSEKVNRLGERKEDQEPPGGQDPSHNHSNDKEIGSQDEAGIEEETLVFAEQDPNRLDPLTGIISDVPEIVCQENQSYQNPERDGDINQ